MPVGGEGAMTEDPNRRTLRQFQCRDYLWETFEQMSQELECSVDYLINEAMRHYARSQGKLRQGTTPPAPAPQQRMPPPMAQPPQQAMAPMAPQGQGRQGMQGGAPNAMRPGPNPPPLNGGPRPQALPTAPGYGAPQQQPQRIPPTMQQPQQQQPQYQQPQYQQPPQQQQPPRQAPPNYAPQAAPSAGVLFALYEGQKYPVNKDEFFIGRSNKTCDLIVKDPNVSRQHARIVRHQGQFWMVDMGSTNGIEYQGSRVERRPIAEGDVFRICDHEIAFTYR